MDDRSEALAEIVTTARRHGLTLDEIARALEGGTPGPSRETRARGVLVRVLGYLGGTFVFAGLGVFVALQWDTMSSAARIVVTLGSGLAAFVLALIASRDERYEKATTPMTLIAAALEPAGMLVTFAEFGSGGDPRLAGVVTCAAMALQFAAAFRWLRRTTPLFLTIAFGALFWWTTFDLLDVDNGMVGVAMGGSLVLAAAGVDRTMYRVITPFWYFVGAALLLFGLFDLVEGTPLEVLFLVFAAGLVYLSVTLHSRTLLGVATLGILAYTGWFTSEHFADSVGWPIALMLFGLLMIALSALAFRIDRDYVRAPSD